jgi:hypothetical protein
LTEGTLSINKEKSCCPDTTESGARYTVSRRSRSLDRAGPTGMEAPVSRYLITIAPDNGGTAGGSAHTTVRVDTSTGQARITELTVRSTSDSGLAPTDLPAIDMDLLIRALTAAVPAQALPPTVESATLAGAGRASRPDAPTSQSASVDPAAAAPRRRGPKAAAAKATPAKKTARKSAGRKATAAKKAASTKSAKAASRRVREAPATATGGTRAYRRMPDPEQVMDAYRQTGTIGGVAEHFNVPRHTVAGWARRLRSLGHTIGPQ